MERICENAGQGRVVFITGAASGIGREAALRFAAEGGRIAATDVNLDKLGAVRAEIEAQGGECLAIEADVRSESSMQAAASAAEKAFGRLDVAIANAGFGISKPFWELEESEWQLVTDVNLSGAWRTAKAVAPAMMRQKSGVILFTGSTAGARGAWDLSAYVAAKHGLVGLSRAVALELSRYDVRANVVMCGTIKTPRSGRPEERRRVTGKADATYEDFLAAIERMHALSDVPIAPSAVINAFLWLASPAARYVTGAEIPVDGGRLALPGYNLRAGGG